MDIFLFIAEVKNATLENSWSHSASVILLSKYVPGVCDTDDDHNEFLFQPTHS